MPMVQALPCPMDRPWRVTRKRKFSQQSAGRTCCRRRGDEYKMNYEQLFITASELTQRRGEEHGDADLVALAALLVGRKAPVSRRYGLEKLHQLSKGASPFNLLDPHGLRRYIRALEEHWDAPIRWLADQAGLTWWT